MINRNRVMKKNMIWKSTGKGVEKAQDSERGKAIKNIKGKVLIQEFATLTYGLKHLWIA